MKLLIAWVKKKLGIQSPSAILFGYKYEYDYLESKGRRCGKGMTQFIILSWADILTVYADKPVTVYVDKKPYVLCTNEYFEKQRNEPQESEEVV